jgi:hypothetical protein
LRSGVFVAFGEVPVDGCPWFARCFTETSCRHRS